MRRLIGIVIMLATTPVIRAECVMWPDAGVAAQDASHSHHAPDGPEQGDHESGATGCVMVMCAQAPTAGSRPDRSNALPEHPADAAIQSTAYVSPDLTFDPPPPKLLLM